MERPRPSKDGARYPKDRALISKLTTRDMLLNLDNECVFSVHFPGAVNSKFTTRMSFERPSTHPAIPTYRVMDSDGVIVDETKKPLDVNNEEVLQWYKNMLTSKHLFCLINLQTS